MVRVRYQLEIVSILFHEKNYKSAIRMISNITINSVVTIPDFAMRYISRYLGHDAIRIAILVYRVSKCL